MSDRNTSLDDSLDESTVVRRLSVWLALALVGLRFCAGVHFYSEGTKKLSYDTGRGELKVDFSAEGFLRQAPDFHRWEELLVRARPNFPSSAPTQGGDEQGAEGASDGAPYGAWLEELEAGFEVQQQAVARLRGLSGEQKEATAERLQFRLEQLRDYLAGEADAIAAYQHELWRLAEWEADPGAESLPFKAERIAEKRAELRSQPQVWVQQVRGIERGFHDDLRGLVNAEQREAGSNLPQRITAAVTDPKQARLDQMNWFITGVITAIGICLMFGFLTRLAALGGAAFLLMVMATQPPWVEGAVTLMFYYQLVECMALIVLCVAGAGQWAGLDGLIRGWFTKGRRSA